MTKSCQEQYPLLHEDLEHFNPQLSRRMALRTRVRNKVNGAASIIRSWPGHWSSALTNWWIGFGMIAIITLLIYNVINAVALIPSAGRIRFIQTVDNNIEKSPAEQTSSLPDIFMHVHINVDDELDLNKYLPYIEILSNIYKDYVYHLVIVINDIHASVDHVLTAENKFNYFALNTLLNSSKGGDKIDVSGLIYEQISLTEYLDTSPLKEHWRHIPYNLIEFLVRALSIWDKGGIAFNPIILTPFSPHAIYIEKLHAILERFINERNNKACSENEVHTHSRTNIKHNKKPPKLNNIRDIIDAMEKNTDHENKVMKLNNLELTSLESAESKFLNPVMLNILNDTKVFINKISSSLLHHNDNKKTSNNENLISQRPNNEVNNVKNSDINGVNKILETNTTSNSIGPVILRHLKKSNENSSVKNITRKRKSAINRNEMSHEKEKNKENLSIDDKIVNNTSNSTMKAHINDINVNIINDDRYLDPLTIDIKGNILATKISCHAFIGTLFSNVVHDEPAENITEFILHELSLFCKGLSCSGFDVIFPM